MLTHKKKYYKVVDLGYHLLRFRFYFFFSYVIVPLYIQTNAHLSCACTTHDGIYAFYIGQYFLFSNTDKICVLSMRPLTLLFYLIWAKFCLQFFQLVLIAAVDSLEQNRSLKLLSTICFKFFFARFPSLLSTSDQ